MTSAAFALGGRYEGMGADTSDTSGTTITAAGSADTKGSYTQLIASTSYDYEGLLIHLEQPDTGNAGKGYLIDVAIGAASSEKNIVQNFLFSRSQKHFVSSVLLPVHVPGGSRLSARCQGTAGSLTIDLIVHGMAGGPAMPRGFSKAAGIGADLSNTGGVLVDAGASTNTKGPYAEVAASTPDEYAGLVPCIGHNENTTLSNASFLYDIARGGAGSEKIILANVPLAANDANDRFSQSTGPFFPIGIPAGTRLAVRSQSTTGNSADRRFDIVLMGLVP